MAGGGVNQDNGAGLLDAEKTFYERFFALHADPDLVEVFKKFGIGVFRRSSVLEGFADFVKRRNFSGRRCVEIGTCKGLTAIVLSRYFEEVVSIDVVEDPHRHEIAAYLGIGNIEFITVKDNAWKSRAIEAIEFDAAYVDGDHIRDTLSDFALVRRCGRVLFHEFWPAQPAVWGLVNRLSAEGSVVAKGKLALWTS